MSKKKDFTLRIIFIIMTAILYFGFTTLNATVFYSMNINFMRFMQFMAMVLSGTITYGLVWLKYRKYNPIYYTYLITSVVVVNIFRIFVVDFSISYTLLVSIALVALFNDLGVK